MYTLHKLFVKDLEVEHLHTPLGIDVKEPRFSWKLYSDGYSIYQTSYRLQLFDERHPRAVADTGIVETDQSIEVIIPDFQTSPMTRYLVRVTVTDNQKREASLESHFETGRMGIPFKSSWAEPVQDPTPSTMNQPHEGDAVINTCIDGKRDFHEFRPAQYIRISFDINKPVKKARIYATAHGLYKLSINGMQPDDRMFAPENTAYHSILLYQTYDISELLQKGSNVIGAVLADGWWAGRVGTTGDCCQYGNTTALLLDADIEYMDGTKETVTGDQGVSSTGPIIFSDLFVGEKYYAEKEIPGWDLPGFDASRWAPVKPCAYDKKALTAQSHPPVRILKSFKPISIFTSPNGDTILDAGQNLAGFIRFTVTTRAGREIKLEHFETLDKKGNYFNSILNNNKEQTEFYRTKNGLQTYQPSFTYHGFRYVRITGWPGKISTDNFEIIAISSEMDSIGSFHTSDERINQLQNNIWWSQVSNSISIPTDCPQREKAGWTGDIMAYSPTFCFNRSADAFLSSWMNNLRSEQLPDGAVPMIIPYLKAYATFLKEKLGTDTSCGWGDAAIIVPYNVYKAYGDRKILEDNYQAMKRWMGYIDSRAKNHHPKGYKNWDEVRRKRSRWLWNTDFHFGDWLIPSIVLGNPDAKAMDKTAYATMGIVAPAYYAFSAQNMAEIASVLGKTEDSENYRLLYENIRKAFIEEYIHDDGTLDADFQGIYVICLKVGLVSEAIRPKMVQHLVNLIESNQNRLDTGFLSIPFLMDVLCENGKNYIAYRILYQTACPSWLYEISKGASTLWESWGAIDENGTVSTYSYNHYAFGCIGDWMYRYLGGLTAVEPGYRTFEVAPHFDCGLTEVSASENTPYGRVSVNWRLVGTEALVHVEVPVNTTARIHLPGQTAETGSGIYNYLVHLNG